MPDASVKQCHTCRQVLPLDRFYRKPNRRDGLTPTCKPCHKAYCQSHQFKNRGQGRLTPRQAEVVRAVYAHMAEYGRVPNLEELATYLGMSRAGAHLHIRHLAEAGWVELLPGRRYRLKGVRMLPTFDATPDGVRLCKLLEANRG